MTNLNELVDRVEKINQQNEDLRSFWKDFYDLKTENRTPIIVTLTMSFFAKNLGLDLVNHYEDPERYVEDSLRIISFQHSEINDDRAVGSIVITFGEAFEPSLFGVKPTFSHNRDPVPGKPIIRIEKDLGDLDYPDFYESGLMPQVHRTYEAAQEIVEGRIPVRFETWDRSPWGLAVHLRGLTELLKDTIRNPDFVHRLLKFLAESRMRWEGEKERFLDAKTRRSRISDDEVDAKLISLETYESFAYPYEKELADFYPEGIFYFHSCGDITPFLNPISKIRGLRRIHISPATNFKTALREMGRTIAYHKRMDPVNDLALCNAEKMQSKVEDVLRTGKDAFMELDPGPIMDIPAEKVKTWITSARRAISNLKREQ
jgi:uroporphyrinogen-III decarboxylase